MYGSIYVYLKSILKNMNFLLIFFDIPNVHCVCVCVSARISHFQSVSVLVENEDWKLSISILFEPIKGKITRSAPRTKQENEIVEEN